VSQEETGKLIGQNAVLKAKLEAAEADRDHWCQEMLAETIRADKAEAAARRLRILLAWSNGTLKLHEAAAMLGVEPGELWAMERAEMEVMRNAQA
jgi:hypothetical protein